MRAHWIVVSGDMPAISKASAAFKLTLHMAHALVVSPFSSWCFKGIRAKFPCRWCTTPAIRAGENGAEYGKYYLATKGPDHPDNVDYDVLPCRTHDQVMQDIREIRQCRTKGAMEDLQKAKGINNQVRNLPSSTVDEHLRSNWLASCRLCDVYLAGRLVYDRRD